MLAKPGIGDIEAADRSAGNARVDDDHSRPTSKADTLGDLAEDDQFLRQSRDRLELVFEIADIGIWEYHFATRTVQRSLRHDQCFGYETLQPKWSRRIAREHFLPEDRPLFDEAFARGAEEGRLSLEARVRWPDGSIHWLRTVGRTYYDDAGEPVRMVGVITDETERRYAAEAIEESEARFRTLADAMPQLVWTARADGTVDYYNRRMSEYDGFELIDGVWRWDPVLHQDDLEATKSAWTRSVETGRIFDIEHRVRMADGTFRWHLSRSFPVHDDDGRVVKWYGTATDIHDVKTAQSEAQRARERLEVALEAAEMGSWETDYVAGTSHRSLRHDQIFGYDSLQPTWGLDKAREHVVPEDLDVFDRAVEEAERTGKLRHEVRIYRPDGSIRWIHSLGRQYYAEDGRATRRAGVVMDITERKEAEEALRQREWEFTTLADNIPQMAWMTHPDGHIFWFNRRWYEYTGTTLPEVEGWGWRRVHHPDHEERVANRFSRHIRDGIPWEDLFPLRRADGEYRWFLSRAVPIRDDEGQIVRWFGTNTDVTEQRELEEALRSLNESLEHRVADRTAELEAARDHLRTVFNASPTPAAIVHRGRGDLLDVNDDFAAFFGHPRDELIGRTLDELQFWGDPDERRQIIRRVMRKRRIRDIEMRVRLHDGSERIVLVAVEPIEFDDQPFALVKFVDITERKQAEEAVRQLTSALTLAEQRERRRLSEVLHDDLQQILFGIEMRTAVLEKTLELEGGAGAEVDEHIQYVRELLRHAVKSTRALSVELNPPILPGEGLAAALRWLSRHMEEMHGLEVDLLAEDELDVLGSDERILVVQLARELLFNVVKHAGVGVARLTAEVADGNLMLQVEDQGKGFEITPRPERSPGGSLGLVSVEKRVRLLGGQVDLQSSPGAGTRVRVLIPVTETSAAETAHASPRAYS